MQQRQQGEELGHLDLHMCTVNLSDMQLCMAQVY